MFAVSTSLAVRILLVFLAFFSANVAAWAHPHVFVEARTRLVFDDDGSATAVRHIFRFDDAFTAFAIQGFDTNGDGAFSREELAELAQVNIESMAEFGYFTFGDNTRIEFDFDPPEDYWLEVATVPLKDYWVMKPEDFEAMAEDVKLNGTIMPETVQLLELHFLLPLKEESTADQTITLDVYDPTYYVDFRFGRESEATGLENAPGSCEVERREPPALDDATAFALAQIGPEQRDLPPELQSAAASQVNQMIINCSAAALGTSNDGASIVAKTGEATTSNDSVSAAPGGALDVSLADRWFGTIARLQQEFYQKLISAMRAFRSNPNAGWLLIGLSFAYGIFHAAGPGHGKAIISSYVVANNETLKKGIALSFVSAFAQAVTAVLLVGVAAIVLKLTSIAIQDTARWFEIGSYALVTGLGGYLLWQKALLPILRPVHAADDHHIGKDGVCSTCGHAHAPTPEMLRGHMTLGRAASIVLAVGLRPCSGALIVLVFALSQSMLGPGIAATFAMAVGTGITVSILAGLAVGAKGLAVRLFGDGSVVATRVHRTIEIAGALTVLLLGSSLLIATIGWG
ncbi:DUF1007 family protein [Labrenzia sp. CE80]|uniref:HoxN/HupN/NixA family nickel/cobalt transporter n=1 Tax=Labrenzia sp. CE80 TaxID=1788986 RepID=UPI001AD8CB87|nr:DUF1007 family protein [Labrenzia sp. CE80]